MTQPQHVAPPEPVPLGHWPTPLEPLPRLSEELGGPKIWLKRDDCTGLATGGNKTRKLEYLLGEAIATGCNTVITFGAVQSNHARQTAAACAKLGLDCHLILSHQVNTGHRQISQNYANGGNVLLDKLMGAHCYFVDPQETKATYTRLKSELEGAGQRIYTIPAGGSNPLGALGYSQCAQELQTQFSAARLNPGCIVHASSSAGTQAGLLYGFARLGVQPKILGINVYHADPTHLANRVNKLLEEMAARYGAIDPQWQPQVAVNHAYIGEGYGQPTAETLGAIELAATLEGVIFDPAYSGKALAAVIDQINLGNFHAHDDVVLIHTGGAAAVNVYQWD